MSADLKVVETKFPTVDELEVFMLEQEQAECPVRHIFGDGLYIREVTFKADTWAIGHHQKFTQMNIMIKGKVKMYNSDGTTKILEAPLTFMGPPGRKAGYIIEDTVWQNVYATNEKDVGKLEDYFLDKSEASLLKYKEDTLLLEDKSDDIKDYELLLEELGMTEDQVQNQVQNLEDRIDLPNGNYKFRSAKSNISGEGVFATSSIKPWEIIGPAKIDGLRTILGYGVNHSTNPNAIMMEEGGDVFLVSVVDIAGSTGGKLGDEITISYRETIKALKDNEKRELI